MNNRHRLLALVTFLVATLLVACGTPSSTSSSGSTGAAGVVPDPLQTMEEAAEDIIDMAPGGKWDTIAKDTTAIAGAWTTYQPQAAAAGASQTTQDALSTALTRLQTASAAKNPQDTMQAANDLSAAVIEMFALYNPTIPAAVGQLDVLERQVVLDVAADDYTAAAATLARAQAVWESVKASVLSHDGMKVAAQFEESLAAQAAAIQAKDKRAVATEANNGLELVDGLETLY